MKIGNNRGARAMSKDSKIDKINLETLEIVAGGCLAADLEFHGKEPEKNQNHIIKDNE